MEYTVRRVGVSSAARLGCLIGWLVALGPALVLALLALVVLRWLDQTLGQVRPITLNLLGRDVLRIDLLEELGLLPLTQTIGPWVDDPTFTVLFLTVLLALIGGAVWTATLVLASLVYNLAARLGWGLAVDLDEARRSRTGQ